MSELDELAERGKPASPWLLTVDARVKIVLVALGLLLNLLAADVRVPLGLTAVALAGLWSANAARRYGWRRLLVALPVVLVLPLVEMLFRGGHPLLVLHFAGRSVVFYREGLDYGILLVTRVMAGVAFLVFLQAAVPGPELLSGLGWLGVPALLVEIALLVWRYVFVLAEETLRIRGAARVRLGMAGWRLALFSYSSLAGMILWRAFDRAESVHRAMRARAYRGQVVPAAPPPLARRDLLAGAGGIVLLLLVFSLGNWT